MIGKDTPNEVQLRARECIRQALRVNAAAVTLWHSHPSGPACPIRADLAHLANLVVVLENAGVALSDYMIVSPYETFSARSAGLLSFHAAMKLHEVSVPDRPTLRARLRLVWELLQLLRVVFKEGPQDNRR